MISRHYVFVCTENITTSVMKNENIFYTIKLSNDITVFCAELQIEIVKTLHADLVTDGNPYLAETKVYGFVFFLPTEQYPDLYTMNLFEVLQPTLQLYACFTDCCQ